MNRTKHVSILVFVVGLCILFSLTALAGEGFLKHNTVDSGIVVYSSEPQYEDITECSAQIGLHPVQSVKWDSVKEIPGCVETIFLIDNSLSVNSKYRPLISETLKTLVNSHLDGEKYTLICFSDEPKVVLEKTDNYEAVLNALDEIEYQDQETYLTDVLYDLIANDASESGECFNRIVIVSDGVDNKSIGYSREELNSLLEDSPYTIYAIGCDNGNNNEQLKKMFALSRLSGGEGYLLNNDAETETIVDGLMRINHATRIFITPESEDCDGMKKAVLLSFTTPDGVVEKSFETSMPFGDASSVLVEKFVIEKTKEDIKMPKLESDLEMESEDETDDVQEIQEEISAPSNTKKSALKKIFRIFLVLMIPGIVIAVIVCIVIFVKNRKGNSGKNPKIQQSGRKTVSSEKSIIKKPKNSLDRVKGIRNEKKGPEEDYDKAHTQILLNNGAMIPIPSDDDLKTTLITDDDNKTVRVSMDRNELIYTICLSDKYNSDNKYERELYKPILVGRNHDCDIVINNDSVSRKHLRITQRNGKVYVENLSEMNGTLLNSRRVNIEEELTTGDELTLGRVILEVRMIKE